MEGRVILKVFEAKDIFMKNFFSIIQYVQKVLVAFFVFAGFFSYSSVSKWELKKNSFDKHIQSSYMREVQKAKNKKIHIQSAKKIQNQRRQSKQKFLNSKLHVDRKAGNQKFFQTFTAPFVSYKKNLKKQYVEGVKKEEHLKNIHKIPLEKKIFL